MKNILQFAKRRLPPSRLPLFTTQNATFYVPRGAFPQSHPAFPIKRILFQLTQHPPSINVATLPQVRHSQIVIAFRRFLIPNLICRPELDSEPDEYTLFQLSHAPSLK